MTLQSDAARKAKQRAEERDLKISRPADVARRRACLEDPYLFMRTYFPGIFYQQFTPTRRQMADAILHAARYGGDQAIAGPRGDGKTRLALFCALYLMLGGQVHFPLIISKSGPRAARELKNLKHAIEESVRDKQAFALDFPEICEPLSAIGRWASKARQQTAYGTYTELEWGEECVILPTIKTATLKANAWLPADPESAARGQIVASLGIEGPIRGYSVRNRRPDMAVLDDLDDRESARSEMQTETREKIIEEDIGGLAGPDRTISRVMLCTLINRTCIAAMFTGDDKKSWGGQRHKLLAALPDNRALWDEFVDMRKNRNKDDDPDGRVAHQFYLERREAMDAGAVVTNEFRFDSRLLKDGKPKEASALEACYNIIADRGWDHFATEYNNDPPEESAFVESGINPRMVQTQLSGLRRGVIPAGCTVLAHGIDIGKTKGWHFVVRAFRPDGTGYTIDYGNPSLVGSKYGSEEGLDRAIYDAVLRRMEEFREARYATADGAPISEVISIFDARWKPDTIYKAVTAAGMGVHALLGIGQSGGVAMQGKFRDLVDKTHTKRKCGTTGAYEELHTGDYGKCWVIHSDADRWKAREHEGWMTARDKPGCLFVFGEEAGEKGRLSADERTHDEYANHICAEIEAEVEHRGFKVLKWIAKGKQNDYLDASAMTNVGAAIKGIRVLSAAKLPPLPATSLREMANAARRRTA